MATYERRTRLAVPLETVWEFHASIGGLRALTPDWMRLRVEAVIGPSGEHEPAVLEAGTEVRLSVRPFGVGRRTRWTSRITDREEEPGEAWFRDEMVDGPFRRWVHTHRFRADAGGTIVVDHVDFALPRVPWLSPLAKPGFGAMFRHRHRRLHELLE